MGGLSMPIHKRFAKFHRTMNGVHERQCSICEKWWPFTRTHFHRTSQGNLHGQCKKCLNAKMRVWYNNHREQAKQRERERYTTGGESKRRVKTFFDRRRALLTHRGIAKAVSNGVPPALVLQRIFIGRTR